MIKSDAKIYRSPSTGSPLELIEIESNNDEIIQGHFISKEQEVFEIKNGIPDFTWPKHLSELDQKTKNLYDNLAKEYEKFADIPFKTFHTEESVLREKITEKLNLSPDSTVLEVGGGDGRGAEHIAKRLTRKGKLFFQELSPGFLKCALERLQPFGTKISYSIANASYLSFPNDFFDAAHHFGGINTFSEIQRCLKELSRVVKPGGKVVIGDEGIGPWLKETEFAKIMINSNPLIGYEAPISLIPVEARDVKIEWVMMGAFFIIEFTVGEGAPVGNYHIPIPSERGGTHWSRYYGNLEGITDSTKELAYKAKGKSGKSMHEWLDNVVKEAALKELKN